MPGAGPIGLLFWQLLTYLLLAAVAAGAAATLYRYGPSREKAKWTWLTPGSVFFAVFWMLLTLGFGFYVSNFGSYGATYGSLSAVVVLLTWLYLSSYVLLFGAELNSEIEHQTAKDTTTGGEKPLGTRKAWSADHVAAGKTETTEDQEQSAGLSQASATPSNVERGEARPVAPEKEHPFLTSRVTSRAGQLAGARKIGMVTSGLATLGLGFLRKRGKEKTGAALLVTAAGLALLRR
jgi:membrane protein